ncbi:MAG TPA: universal stress protein [Fimbriimonadaceae bacterium]|jgi:hypothetical protein
MIVESYDDVIVLSGQLRTNLWETVHTAISLTLKRHPAGVIIDCSGLTNATPEGAETFRDILEFTKRQEARVIVAAVPENVLEVLRSVSEVRSRLAIAKSVEDARTSLEIVIDGGKSRKKNGEKNSSILLCLTGRDVDKEALEIASQLAEAREADLHLVYIVVVPRELPLTSPLPEQEAQASKALELCCAKSDRHVRIIPHLERGRDVLSTIENYLQANKISLLVIPVAAQPTDPEARAAFLKSAIQRIPQQVVIVRGAKEA